MSSRTASGCRLRNSGTSRGRVRALVDLHPQLSRRKELSQRSREFSELALVQRPARIAPSLAMRSPSPGSAYSVSIGREYQPLLTGQVIRLAFAPVADNRDSKITN